MDNKNVFIDIALSMSVLLFWAAFFETPKPINNNTPQQQLKNNENIKQQPEISILNGIYFEKTSIEGVKKWLSCQQLPKYSFFCSNLAFLWFEWRIRSVSDF